MLSMVLFQRKDLHLLSLWKENYTFTGRLQYLSLDFNFKCFEIVICQRMETFVLQLEILQ